MSLSLPQHASATAATTSVTVTITTPTAGDLIVLSVMVIGNVANITPPAGYTLVDTANHTTVDGCKMYYRIADGTEGTSVTVTCAGATSMSATYDQYHSTNGAFVAGCLDKHGAASNTGTASIASASITPTKQAFVLASCMRTTSNATTGVAASNSFVVEDLQRTNRDDYADLLVAGGSGSYSTTWSWTASSNMAASCIIANFTEPTLALIPTGVTTGEVVATNDKLVRVLAATGIVSGEALGTGDKLTRVVLTTSVVSGEAFGQTDRLVRVLVATGIVSGETVGTGDKIVRLVFPIGIVTREAFGQTDRLVRVIAPVAIAPAETFGVPTVSGGVAPFVPIGAYVAVSDQIRSSVAVSDSAVMYVLVSDSLLKSASASDAI